MPKKSPNEKLAFIISILPPDSERNARLSRVLIDNGYEVEVISGVMGSQLSASDYYNLIAQYFFERGAILTPGEVGCSLSHIKALRRLIESNADRAVVFEDDVLFDEYSLSEVDVIFSKDYVQEYIVHLGGNQGLKSREELEGMLVDRSPDVFILRNSSLVNLWRTVGYIISKNNAIKLLEFIGNRAVLIDDFDYLIRSTQIHGIMYSDVIIHPTAITASTIEQERNLKNSYSIEKNRYISARIKIKKAIEEALAQRITRLQKWRRGKTLLIPMRRP